MTAMVAAATLSITRRLLDSLQDTADPVIGSSFEMGQRVGALVKLKLALIVIVLFATSIATDRPASGAEADFDALRCDAVVHYPGLVAYGFSQWAKALLAETQPSFDGESISVDGVTYDLSYVLRPRTLARRTLAFCLQHPNELVSAAFATILSEATTPLVPRRPAQVEPVSRPLSGLQLLGD